MLAFRSCKVPSSRGGAVVPDDGRARSEVFKELLSDVGSMQGRQEQMDQLLADMKKENGALWREVARLRQEHLKQQQIVEKLIQFLITMVQANRNITVKRKIPLMLHDSPSTRAKMPRLAKNAFIADYHAFSSSISVDDEKSTILGHKQASNGASDLLSSCIMLEDIPTLEGEVEPPETASPLGLADLATEASSKHKKEKAVAPRSPGMQVALHDKAAGAAK
ncbi:hypothetical protein HPB52_023521 [Rhipicephalus sanguineus]|uniref:Uncharacterized protein n=1 Tax=Rhipicephalus sanguineus TaxID=34632 RepID=A0A9D4TC19_RHISA|nr:hypothetical protein HPB52_023521 [Rhipicephalus sanguineus]